MQKSNDFLLIGWMDFFGFPVSLSKASGLLGVEVVLVSASPDHFSGFCYFNSF